MTAGYFQTDDCCVSALQEQIERSRQESAPVFADRMVSNIPIYQVAELPLHDEQRQALLAEWARVLADGAGALVLRGAVQDKAALQDASAAFERIVVAERDSNSGADHFAAAGKNDRIWNSLQKLALKEPRLFVRCFASPAIDAVCESWLGPAYHMTAQVNIVRPGGKAQQPHRDYHLGFQTDEKAMRYPAHVHRLSPVLTLQGAVAHSDMPMESGPTKLLPGSQRYASGYLAWRRKEFIEHFESHCVQMPLQQGDALFFNPALFHAAGDNRSESVQRVANLLQVSSAFGRAMESVDRKAMLEALYPELLAQQGALKTEELQAVIAASAEGYPFPTNLDRDPPCDAMAPPSQQDLLKRALSQGLDHPAFIQLLCEWRERRRA